MKNKIITAFICFCYKNSEENYTFSKNSKKINSPISFNNEIEEFKTKKNHTQSITEMLSKPSINRIYLNKLTNLVLIFFIMNLFLNKIKNQQKIKNYFKHDKKFSIFMDYLPYIIGLIILCIILIVNKKLPSKKKKNYVFKHLTYIGLSLLTLIIFNEIKLLYNYFSLKLILFILNIILYLLLSMNFDNKNLIIGFKNKIKVNKKKTTLEKTETLMEVIIIVLLLIFFIVNNFNKDNLINNEADSQKKV